MTQRTETLLMLAGTRSSERSCALLRMQLSRSRTKQSWRQRLLQWPASQRPVTTRTMGLSLALHPLLLPPSRYCAVLHCRPRHALCSPGWLTSFVCRSARGLLHAQ